MRHSRMGYKTYDFESDDSWMGWQFLKVLETFHVTPLYSYVQDWDVTQIRFSALPKTRLMIEYTYRVLIHKDRKYLSDLECYQDRARRYREERYAIY